MGEYLEEEDVLCYSFCINFGFEKCHYLLLILPPAPAQSPAVMSPSSSFLTQASQNSGHWSQGLLKLTQAACAQVCVAPSHPAACDIQGRAAACLFLANFSSLLSYMGENNCLHSER